MGRRRKKDWKSVHQELMGRCVKEAIKRVTEQIKGKQRKQVEDSATVKETVKEDANMLAMCMDVLKIYAKQTGAKDKPQEPPQPMDPKMAEKLLAALAGE